MLSKCLQKMNSHTELGMVNITAPLFVLAFLLSGLHRQTHYINDFQVK